MAAFASQRAATTAARTPLHGAMGLSPAAIRSELDLQLVSGTKRVTGITGTGETRFRFKVGKADLHGSSAAHLILPID